jgi:hypothetical protein
MIMARRPTLGAMLMLGAAAYGAYKYSKMSDQQKKDLVNKGKTLVNDNLGGLGKVFGKKNENSAVNGTV